MASGNISASESDRQFIELAQNSAAEIARKNAENNFASQKRGVEEQLLSKGMEGSSIEAVQTALLGKSNQDALNNISLQQQGQAAEQMTSLPFQRAGVQLSANQLLLQKLLGAANPVMQQSLQERLAQRTTTTKTKQSTAGAALQAATRLAAAYVTAGTSEVGEVAGQAAGGAVGGAVV
jgi:hypothetical protein